MNQDLMMGDKQGIYRTKLENRYNIFVTKLDVKRSTVRRRCRSEDNSKINHEVTW